MILVGLKHLIIQLADSICGINMPVLQLYLNKKDWLLNYS